jgi:hypothetical protein
MNKEKLLTKIDKAQRQLDSLKVGDKVKLTLHHRHGCYHLNGETGTVKSIIKSLKYPVYVALDSEDSRGIGLKSTDVEIIN